MTRLRRLSTLLLLALSLTAGSQAQAYDRGMIAVMKDGMPDFVADYVAEVTELLLEKEALAAKEESRSTARKIEKIDEELAELNKEYKEEVKDFIEDDVKDKKERADQKLDRATERLNKAEGDDDIAKAEKGVERARAEVTYWSVMESVAKGYQSYGSEKGLDGKSALPEVLMGDAAKDFRLSPPGSDPRSLETITNRPILVLVFFSVENRSSMSALAKLAQDIRRYDKHVDVVGISVGTTADEYEEARPPLRGVKVLLDPDGQVAKTYNVAYVPQYVVIDADRSIKGIWVGTGGKVSSGLNGLLKDLVEAAEAAE